MPEVSRKLYVRELYRGSPAREEFRCAECEGEVTKDAVYCESCGRRFSPGYKTVDVTR